MIGQPEKRSQEAGFTLLEVLVSLLIFSIAAISIVQLSGFAARMSVLLEGRAMSAIAADNAVVDAVIALKDNRLGDETALVEIGSRRFQVIRRVEETPNPIVLQIVVVAEELDADGNSRGARTERRAFRRVRG